MLSPTNALNPQLSRVYGAGMYDTTSLLSKVVLPPKLRLTGPGTNMKPGGFIDDLHVLTSNEAKDAKSWNRSSTQAYYRGPEQKIQYLGTQGSKLTLTFRDSGTQDGSYVLDFNGHRREFKELTHYIGFWNYDGTVFNFHLTDGKRVAQATEIKNDLYEQMVA